MPIQPLAPAFKFADGPGIDAFGRLRTSSQITSFAEQQVYTNHSMVWDHPTFGTGTATHNNLRSSTMLQTGGSAAGARAMRQSKVYQRYIPGTSLIVKLTQVFKYSGTHTGGAKTIAMFGDDDNGIGLLYDATGWGIVKRTKTSGTLSEQIIRQADWSIDKMNGNPMQSSSMITLDPTKSLIVVLDLQWLGVGRVRFGFQIDGQMYPVHEFVHANKTQGVYMQQATLPVRWEVVNDGAGSDVTMEAICCSVETEGAVEEDSGYPWTISNNTSGIVLSTSTYKPILSVRLADLLNGKSARSHIHFDSITTMLSSDACHLMATINPSLTGASWGRVNTTHSGIEYDVSASALSGGIDDIWATYAGSGKDVHRFMSSVTASPKMMLGKTYAGVSDILTISARALSGTPTLYCALPLIEQY